MEEKSILDGLRKSVKCEQIANIHTQGFPVMEKYPMGTRALFRAHELTGIGIHELYSYMLVRAAVSFLDRLDGTSPMRPR